VAAAGVNIQNADAHGIHFIAQAVRDRTERVLRCGELTGGGGGAESRGRIDEDDLAGRFAQERQHGLDHEVVAAHVRTVHQVKIGE